MNIADIKIGQRVEAEFFFRSGRFGDDCDFAQIHGTVIDKMECYNSILVDVDKSKSFNSPRSSVWMDINKSKIILIN